MKEKKNDKSIKKEEKPIIEKINLNDYVSSNNEKKKGIIGTIILIILVGILLFGDLFDFNNGEKSEKKEKGSKTEEKINKKDDKKKDDIDKKDTSKEEKTTKGIPAIGDTVIANANMKYSASSDRAVLNSGMYSVSESNYYIKPNQELTVNYIAIVGSDGTIYGFIDGNGLNADDFAKTLNVTEYKIVYHVKTSTTDIGWIVYNQTDYNIVK